MGASRLSRFQQGVDLASVRYNVPQEVVFAFNAAFAGQNKSAVAAELMRGVVESKSRRASSQQAIANILARWPKASLRDAAALAAARRAARA